MVRRKKRICQCCGAEYYSMSRNTIYCSEACRSEVYKSQYQARRAEEKKKNYLEPKPIPYKTTNDTLVDVAIDAKAHGMTYGQYVGKLWCDKNPLRRRLA